MRKISARELDWVLNGVPVYIRRRPLDGKLYATRFDFSQFVKEPPLATVRVGSRRIHRRTSTRRARERAQENQGAIIMRGHGGVCTNARQAARPEWLEPIRDGMNSIAGSCGSSEAELPGPRARVRQAVRQRAEPS